MNDDDLHETVKNPHEPACGNSSQASQHHNGDLQPGSSEAAPVEKCQHTPIKGFGDRWVCQKCNESIEMPSAQSTLPVETERADTMGVGLDQDAFRKAWTAFQNTPINLLDDSDDQTCKCVANAIKAFLATERRYTERNNLPGVAQGSVEWSDDDYKRARDCMRSILQDDYRHGRNPLLDLNFDNAFQHAVGILSLTARALAAQPPAAPVETVPCTLCAGVDSPGFYTGCMVKDGHAPEWDCDGKGNLTRKSACRSSAETGEAK